VRIVRPDGTEADPDEAGELLCRSTTLMRGYVGRPEETAAALDDDGWLHTGDLCRRDLNGTLSFVGRRSEMINRGGEKVSPGEVEAVIGAHPGVLRVAVAGVPDERLGQRVAAFVVLAGARRDVAAGVDAGELDRHVRAKLARYKVPEIWRFLPELPLATSGKVAKADLVRGWQHEMGER
jgi:acyl-CoA synthetase (AMP-forming)/AMP-acid ligase II